MRGWITGIAAAVLAGCGGGEEGQGGWAGRGGGRPAGEAALPVRTQAVERGEITSYVETHARLEAERWVEVVSRAQGLAERLRAEEGDLVEEGQILLHLEKEEASLRVRQAEVALDQARAAKERVEALHGQQLVSQEEFESAGNQLENAEVALREAQLSLEYTDIRAPIDGIVMLRQVEQGDLVRANEVLFSVADLDPLQARIQVPEKRMSQIHAGQPARVMIDALPGQVFPATVRRINPGVDPASGTVKVTLDIPPAEALRPGMFATVRIITEVHDQALIIPKKALVLETDQDDVFAVRDGQAKRLRVELGYADGDRIEVLSGLTDGDRVITVGHEGLKDGAVVRVVGEAGEASEAGEAGETAETGGPPVSEAAAGPGDRRAPPDSAAFVARAMGRGLTEEQAVQRYGQMKSRLAEGRGDWRRRGEGRGSGGGDSRGGGR
ncbi:MAG: efflux RND transporter periplasmic adaptor subunit [Gemmatimonadaceae bacterium]|nr:efflux RND transporter periplasmic adaptor subunit [Gemmatimonadaceae bacterium]